jgi:hypothetical protein
VRRIEFLRGFQAIAWGIVVVGLLISFVSWRNDNPSLAVLTAVAVVLALVTHNVLHFLKIDSAEDFIERTPYTNVGLLSALTLEACVLIALVYIHVLPNLDQEALGVWFGPLVWVGIPTLLVAFIILGNLYLPSLYRIEDLHRKSTLRQSQTLRDLREDIRSRTEQLFAIGILPELQRAKLGKEVPPEKIEESLRLAIQKIGGIERILQYMILDKYLELLEGGPESVSRSVLLKWAAAVWAAIIILYEIVVKILTMIGAFQNVLGN